MSVSINFHHVSKVLVEDLYESPGQCITVKMTDKSGQEVCFFFDDQDLKLIPAALHAYAAKRDTPAAPKPLPPTYA